MRQTDDYSYAMAAIISSYSSCYPHLTSLAAAAYARTRKPDDQDE